jgi:serine-type D-Ala-D-Ala carboxypeptidase/endopeptidase (penicillin-binding protein 4)
MDSGERRRAASRAPRLTALLLAVIGTIVLLGCLLEGDGTVPPGESTVCSSVEAAAPDPPPAPPRVEIDGALQARIESQVREVIQKARRLSKGKVTAANTVVSVHVRPARTPGELVSIEADRSLRPASNSKLVTSAAALVVLGGAWCFETRFESDAKIENGRLAGDLVVRAGGDPLYDRESAGRVAHLLAPVAEALREAGVRRVDGDLVLDEGSYLLPAPGPGWPSENQHWQGYCALSGGFSANAGCLTAVVRPGKVGARAYASIRPAGFDLPRKGTVKTVRAGAALKINVGARSSGATLRGEIPSNVPEWEDSFAHPDPVALFASVLRHELEEGGVTIAGQTTRRERHRPAARLLATLRSPLAKALTPINLDSNNSVADQLFFALGAAAGGGGTRAGGARALATALLRLGVSTEGFVQVDGSGLSRENRLTARQLTALLHAVENLDPASATLLFDSLPVAGTTGSLEKRMSKTPAEGRVHAKTGWIGGASALSGYVDTVAGERLCFSVLVSYPRVSGLNTHCWKPLGNDICNTLVQWHE